MSLPDHEIAIRAVEAGSEVIRSKFGTELARYEKSDSDFATDADIEAEEAITVILQAARPEDSVVGEELGKHLRSSNRRWYVDPLCGTLNFAAGTQLVAVNVALRDPATAAVAAVADPFTDEIFWTSGMGVQIRRNGLDHLVYPSSNSRLVEVNLDAPTQQLQELTALRLLTSPSFRAVFQPRVISTSLAVAWVAIGRRAAYVTDGNQAESVHFAAGIALCEAAGCVVSGILGQPVTEEPWGLVVAADQATHREIVEIIRRPLPSS